MNKTLDNIPIQINMLTQYLATRIAQLEQENALLKTQVDTLLHAIPDDVWESLTTQSSNEE